jgi:hypothetical protein
LGAEDDGRPGKCWSEGDRADPYDVGARAYGDCASVPEPEVPEAELEYVYVEGWDNPGVGHEPVIEPE